MLYTMDASQQIRMKAAVPTDTVEVYYLADWLNHLQLFTDFQIYEILKYVRPALEQAEARGWELDGEPLTLVVTESRWIAIAGKAGFLDTADLRLLPRLPSPGVTHILCDIMAMRAMMARRSQLLHKAGQNPTEVRKNEPIEACVG